MCSNRKAPTGIIPLSECSLRSRKEYPWPARRGATPPLAGIGGAGLAVAATESPYEFKYENGTFYYVGLVEGKSRKHEDDRNYRGDRAGVDD